MLPSARFKGAWGGAGGGEEGATDSSLRQNRPTLVTAARALASEVRKQAAKASTAIDRRMITREKEVILDVDRLVGGRGRGLGGESGRRL